MGDLFSESGFFGSADEFWCAQDEAIAARRDGYLAAKWCEVVILERGQHFQSWDFVKAAKKAGGRVYIEPTHTGEVRFHEGYLTQREATKAKKAQRKGAGVVTGEDPSPRPAITNAMQNYLDLHRHAVVRLAVMARPADALRLLIAHAVSSSGNWTVKPDSQRADSKTIGESLAVSAAQTQFEAEAKKVRALLAPALPSEDESGDRVCGAGQHDPETTLRVFQRLLKLKDGDVARIGAFVMAESLAAGSTVVDGFGTHAKVNTREHWTPDQTFFDLMRDRNAVNGMLSELSGKKVADRLVSAKLKDQKAALVTAAACAPTWCPGWMQFPATI